MAKPRLLANPPIGWMPNTCLTCDIPQGPSAIFRESLKIFSPDTWFGNVANGLTPLERWRRERWTFACTHMGSNHPFSVSIARKHPYVPYYMPREKNVIPPGDTWGFILPGPYTRVLFMSQARYVGTAGVGLTPYLNVQTYDLTQVFWQANILAAEHPAWYQNTTDWQDFFVPPSPDPQVTSLRITVQVPIQPTRDLYIRSVAMGFQNAAGGVQTLFYPFNVYPWTADENCEISGNELFIPARSVGFDAQAWLAFPTL